MDFLKSLQLENKAKAYNSNKPSIISNNNNNGEEEEKKVQLDYANNLLDH
jgi:hypothetical protein